MWIALILTIAYVLYLVGTIFSVIWQNKALEKKWTRKIHPMLGLLGFAGFFGFFGFWTYSEWGSFIHFSLLFSSDFLVSFLRASCLIP